jgi:hypothetical protein
VFEYGVKLVMKLTRMKGLMVLVLATNVLPGETMERMIIRRPWIGVHGTMTMMLLILQVTVIGMYAKYQNLSMILVWTVLTTPLT